MKFLVVALMFAGALSVEASETFIPDTLECVSEAKHPAARKFTLRRLNSETPELELDGFSDESFFQLDFTDDGIAWSFSNECDNMYSAIFTKSDLRNLKIDRVPTITGKMDYWQAGAGVEGEDEDGNLAEVVEVTCTKGIK